MSSDATNPTPIDPLAEATQPRADSPFASPQETKDLRPPVRLGILHLMLLTAAAAILMIPTREILNQTTQLPNNWGVIQTIQHLLMAAIMTMPLASLALYPIAYRRGERFPAEPGHWLLLLLGVGVLMNSSVGIIFLAAFASRPAVTLLLILYSLSSLLFSILAGVVAIKVIPEKRWRFAFWVLTGKYVLSAVYYALFAATTSANFAFASFTYLGILNTLGSVAVFVTFLTMAIMDMRESRDWLHWVGVACHLSTYVLSALFQLAMVLLI